MPGRKTFFQIFVHFVAILFFFLSLYLELSTRLRRAIYNSSSVVQWLQHESVDLNAEVRFALNFFLVLVTVFVA